MNEILFKNDIVSIVSSYVNLKRNGRTMVCLCPFHNEKTPSFRVYPDNDSFYCFGCGEGGTVITFIQKIENLSFIDAAKFLAEKSGINFPEDKIDNKEFLEKIRILEVNREAAKFYNEYLTQNETHKGLCYLKSRGLTDSIIRKFGLGFSPYSRRALINHLRGKGFDSNIILKSGLVLRSYTSGEYIDRFYKRIMFPIIDQRDNVIAFGGRALDNNATSKYLNGPDTLVFSKKSNLFSLNFAKKQKEDFFILTEGYMDVISLNKIGISNAVATLGTAITKEQAKLISRFKKKVIIVYDSDEAGIKATERAIKIIRQTTDLSVKIIKLKNFKDPDEFIRNNKDDANYKFLKLVKNSKNDIEYKLKNLETPLDKNNPEHKVYFLREAIKILSNIQDNIEREVWIAKLSNDIGINKNTISDQVKKQQKKNFASKSSKLFKNFYKKNENQKILKAEEAILKYLIFNPQEAFDISKKISPSDFTDFRSKMYAIILEKSNENSQNLKISDFAGKFAEKEMKNIAAIFAQNEHLEHNYSSVLECINTIFAEKKGIGMKNAEFLNVSSIRQYTKMLKNIKK